MVREALGGTTKMLVLDLGFAIAGLVLVCVLFWLRKEIVLADLLEAKQDRDGWEKMCRVSWQHNVQLQLQLEELNDEVERQHELRDAEKDRADVFQALTLLEHRRKALRTERVTIETPSATGRARDERRRARARK